MTNTNLYQKNKSPSSEEARFFRLGISASQTSYELNNGFRLLPGMPLSYLDDSAALHIPGARPLKVADLDGFIVQDVFVNKSTGLNTFLAYNKETRELLIGVAGTNGFGKDWPDTKEDVFRLGSKQSSELIDSDSFVQALRQSIDKIGGIEALKKIVIAGQSLGGGIASILGLGLINGVPGGDKRDLYKTLGIPAEKIFSVSVNGFANEYSAELAGFTKEEVILFNQQASQHRIVVKNVKTGEFDLVSQLGGKFSGTDWILPVEVADGLWALHRLNFGGAEGIDNLYGDLTLLQSGEVPKLDHATLARNLFWLDTHLDLPNNPVSLSWASYVALLVSKPGEGSAALSAMLQSVTAIPKPLTDIVGAISELILRALPVTHAAQALQFLVGGYLGGQMIGSINSPQPIFDFEKAFGPVQAGWSRMFETYPGTNLPAFVMDTNPQTQVMVIKRMDGRSVEIHPDGSQIQTYPEYGIAVIGADGHGTLFLKTTDPVTGDIDSTTVVIKPGSNLKLTADGWQVLTPVDQNEGLYTSVLYRGTEARQREIQFNAGADGIFIDKMSVTSEIVRQLPHSDHSPAVAGGIQHTAIQLSADHVRFVLRDDDRRTIQTIDVITTGNSSETSYRDGQGNLQKQITVEQLNAEASRTTIIGESGVAVESTVIQRYRRGSEIYELEDQIDYAEGTRLLTVRDSLGHITRAESVPIGAMSDAYRETVRDQLDNDVADFLTALRQKDPTNIILSAARIALDYSRSQGTATLQHDNLVSDVSSGLALVTSLRSLQSGDTLAKIGGAVGLFNSSNYLASRLTGSGYLSPAQLGALSQIGAMLSIANLANLGKMIEAGQVGSASASVVSAINGIGYLTGTGSSMMGAGAIIAINPIVMVVAAFALDSLFGEDPPPPPPQASASFYRDQSGALRYRIGNANPLGESILRRELDQLIVRLDQQINQANSSIQMPTHQLQLVASRMPTIQISAWPSRGGNGVDNYFFVVSSQDPLRDESAMLGIARQDLVSLYAETLLLPEAIVQHWELDHLRAKFGSDESNWQTEVEWLRERSPTERQRAQLQADYERSTAQWKAAAKVNLMLSDELTGSDHPFNVTQLGLASTAEDVSRADMTRAQEKLEHFNTDHPIDPLQAARATPDDIEAFVRQRNLRDTVSLQWLKVIAIDLGNDGVQVIDLPGTVGTDLESLQKQRVPRFDVDGDGFREATQWIEPADAILGIDRSGNGLIDNGSEIFNGADTPFDQHGLASLAYLDANNDGLITPLDPVFKQLRLWIDIDGDGSAGQLEVFDLWMRSMAAQASSATETKLASMAVTAIDLANASLEFADGGSAKLTELELLAHTQGVQVSVDPRTVNLNVLHEGGLRENFITLVDDMSALQELLLPSLSAARRNELHALATRYGLNPSSLDFAAIVQSLRATGQAMGAQDTVIYFGNDDVWVDSTVRERLEQMRISFRKLGDPSGSIGADPQLVRIGDSLKAQSLGGNGVFDDRWVQSRKLGANEISSDAPPALPSPEISGEQKALPSDVYSLLAVTKGAQLGGLVTQTAVVSSNAVQNASTIAQATVFSTAQPVARLASFSIVSDEDHSITLGYQQLAQEARLALASEDPTIRLQLIGIRSASHGVVRMDDDGSRLSFTPQKDFVGQVGFTYVLADQYARIYEREVSVRLQEVNDAPLTAGESIASSEDVPLLIDSRALLANDHDIEGDSLSVTGIARVALGRAELLANGMIHYTPSSDQYGVTDTLEYIVRDSRGASSIGRIRISLAAVDDAPSVVAERIINAREDQVLRIAPRLLLRNDFDVDTDARLGSMPLKITAVGSAEHGSVHMESDGEVVFTPKANFNGDASFSYTVMDETGLATTGRALVRIDPLNDAPLAAGEQIDSREDERLLIDPALLLKNDIDTDIECGEKQKLSVISVDQAVGGSVQLKDQMISFTPLANRSGSASFRYTLSDGAGGFAQATVDISLAEVNDAPQLSPLRFNTIEDTELVLPASRLLEGATDVDGDPKLLKLTGVANRMGGTVVWSDDQLKFKPSADFSGTASFEYTITEGLGAKTTGIATIDINGVNDAPVLIAGSRFEPIGNEDQEIRVAESALTKIFWDTDSDALKIDTKSLKAINAGDAVRFDEVRREMVFRAAPNVNGLRQFSFSVTDDQVSSEPMAINVNLRPVNDAPVVNAVGFQMLEDGGATDPTKSDWSYLSHSLLLSGATDVEGDTLVVANVANAQTLGDLNPQSVEVFNDASNQRIGIRAPLNYTGVIAFDFTISDGRGGETTQKAYGAVSAVNDVPYLTTQRTATSLQSFGRSVPIDWSTWQVSAWDPDADQTVQIGIARNPLRGAVSITGNSAAPDLRGGVLTTATVTTNSGRGWTTSNETVWFSATDSVGASAQISISFTGRYSTDPIVIDLGRDGFNFIDIDQSQVSFLVNGENRRSAWIGAGEGILAYDVDHDGRIQRLDEIVFGGYADDPMLSDLQALQHVYFDTNQDGIFDGSDAKWSDFLLWQDLNSNGVSETGELRSLTAAGIEGLYLNANVLNRAEGADVRVRGYTRVLMNDGRLLQTADVWLGLDHPDRLNPASPDPTMQQVSLLGSDQFSDLLQQLANAPQQGNRAPLVYGYMPTQFADEGQPFRLEIAPNFFIDADTNDPVRIDARITDGSALPAWLHWDTERLLFEGTPGQTDAGKLQLSLIATDHQGASSTVSFTLVTTETNRAPVVSQPLETIGWITGNENAFRIPATLFVDPNKDDALLYRVSLADGSDLPSWMSFDAANAVLSGKPDDNQLRTPVSLKIAATDLGGLTTSTIVAMAAARFGTEGNDKLIGSGSDEYLWGEGGNDVLNGGAGNDILIGGSGNDVYVFERGFGQDTIIDQGGVNEGINTIRFGTSVSRWNTWLFRDRDSLYVVLYDNGQSDAIADQSIVMIRDYYKHPDNDAISAIEFSDGTIRDGLREMRIPFGIGLGSGDDILTIDEAFDYEIDAGEGNNSITTSSGNDQIFSGDGNDTLNGGGGDDYIAGGAGSDTYVFNSYWGWDEIAEVKSSSDHNVIRFGEGIRPSDVLISRNLNDMSITDRGSMSRISISDEGGQRPPSWSDGLISAIQFATGEVWTELTDKDIAFNGSLDWNHLNFTGSPKDDLIWASGWGSTIHGDLGDDAIYGNSGNDRLFGDSGNDTINGGTADDMLFGGIGDDVYQVSSASGNKTVTDIGGIDTLEFNDVANVDAISLSYRSLDLLVGFKKSQGSVTVKNYFTFDGSVNTDRGIDWFRFSDSSQISAASLVSDMSQLSTNMRSDSPMLQVIMR